MKNGFMDFIKGELFPPVLLLIMTALALIANNTGLNHIYESIIDYKIGITIGEFTLKDNLMFWVNDGLMAIFFFSVGLEVKEELLEGHLNSVKKASLPLIAALGGVIVPAIIYASLNHYEHSKLMGFAIPTATDIAFAYGMLLMLGSKIPAPLKIFVLSLAIFDDLVAILMIAIFYATDISLSYLIYAVCLVGVLFIFNRLHITKRTPYILVGFLIWFCVLQSGIHATIAGVTCALFVPLYKKDKTEFLKPMVDGLSPFVNYLILPIFAFFNAGVVLGSIHTQSFNSVFFGVFLGLLVGKQLGVFGFCLIASKLGFIMPANKSKLYGAAILTGIGFTMSFFVNTLVFEDNEMLFNSTKLAVLSASFLSAVLGYIWLKFIAKDEPQTDIDE